LLRLIWRVIIDKEQGLAKAKRRFSKIYKTAKQFLFCKSVGLIGGSHVVSLGK